MLSGTKLAGGSPDRGRVENDFYATNPKAVETDYDVTNGHSSYREYCTKTGGDKKIIGFIHCKKCS